MIIQTERLILRAFKKEDFDWYYNLLQDSSVKESLRAICSEDKVKVEDDFSILQNADFENYFCFAVVEKDNHKPIGIILGIRIVSRVVDVSYCVFEEYRNKGYASEALLSFVNETRKVNPVFTFRLLITPDNKSSIKVAEKANAEVQSKDKEYLHYYI